MVGRKVRKKAWSENCYIKILYVGDKMFFGKDTFSRSNRENSWDIDEKIDDNWEFYVEEEPKLLLAPALINRVVNAINSIWYLTTTLYGSMEEVQKIMLLQPYDKIIWPATPNKDGYYEV